jgi:hypothetical protein
MNRIGIVDVAPLAAAAKATLPGAAMTETRRSTSSAASALRIGREFVDSEMLNLTMRTSILLRADEVIE